MEAKKRERLEAAGWKIGSVRDFFGLSAEEAAFVETKANLSRSLRARDGDLLEGQALRIKPSETQ